MKNGKWIPATMLLVVGGLLFWAMRYTEPGRQFADAIVGCPYKEKAATYDALMKQVAGGAPPDTILATAFDKLNRGMTEDQAREVVEECTKNWMVSSSRTTPPEGKEGEVRLLWHRYGKFEEGPLVRGAQRGSRCRWPSQGGRRHLRRQLHTRRSPSRTALEAEIATSNTRKGALRPSDCSFTISMNE